MKLEEILTKKQLGQIDADIYRMKREETAPALEKTLALYGLMPEKTSWFSLVKLSDYLSDNPTVQPVYSKKNTQPPLL